MLIYYAFYLCVLTTLLIAVYLPKIRSWKSQHLWIVALFTTWPYMVFMGLIMQKLGWW